MLQIYITLGLFAAFLLSFYAACIASFLSPSSSGQDERFSSGQLSFLSFEPEKTEAAVLELIANARQTIEVSLYGFENEPIADALVEAYEMRGVDVRMSSEFDSEASPSFQKVIRHGVPVRFGNAGGIMHNKYFIIDRKYLLTGSTNLTTGLFKHFNNTIIIKNKELAQEFLRDFEIQYAGYYASRKDYGHNILIGSRSWQHKSHQFPGGNNITAYFTPYKKTFSVYTANRNQDTLLIDTPLSKPLPTCLGNCSGTNTRGETTCPMNLGDNACYTNRNKICYRYMFYDCPKDINNDFEIPCMTNPTRGNPMPLKTPFASCRNYDNAMNQVISLLRNAKESILVLAFSFRDRVVMHELIRAHEQRGVDVKVYIDYNQYKSGLKDSGRSFDAVARLTSFLKICRRPNGGLLHHKILVIDNKTIVLGSMNFSSNAVNSNDENFVIIRKDFALAESFYQEAARIDQYSFYLTENFRERD